MKVFIGLLVVLISSTVLISIQNTEGSQVKIGVTKDYNLVLDRYVELGSKTLFLHLKWNENSLEDNQIKLQSLINEYHSFLYLNVFLEVTGEKSVIFENKQFYNTDLNKHTLSVLNSRIETNYQELIKARFNDENFLKAVKKSLEEIRKSNQYILNISVLDGINKALASFHDLGNKELKTQREKSLSMEVQDVNKKIYALINKNVQAIKMHSELENNNLAQLK